MSVVEAEGQKTTELSIPAFPSDLENARAAVKKLGEGITGLHDAKDQVSFWMGVSTETGKATLIPFPSPQNIEKLKDHLDALPEGIQKAIIKNVPSEHMEATKALFDAIEQTRLAGDAKKKSLPTKK